MIELKKFVFGPFSENTYLLFDTDTHESLVIDPGNMDPYENSLIINFIKNNNLTLNQIIVTHSHIDHILGVKCLKDTFESEFFAPEKDMPLLFNAEQQASMFGIEFDEIPQPNKFLSEDMLIVINKISGRFLFTPGHTPGEHSIYFESLKMLFSGDVLFKESIGRTDLWGGNFDILLRSINEKLFNLPDDVIVYPGHGDETSIGYEKMNNPFLKENQ